MSPTSKARCLAATGAVAGGILTLVLPVMDLLVQIPVQLFIASGVAWMLGKPVQFLRTAPWVLAWAALGFGIGLWLEIFVLILGKLVLAPLFSLVWCYLLGEVALLSASRR